MFKHRKFDRCQASEVVFVPFYKPLERQANRWEHEEPDDTDEYDVSLAAELHCPRSNGTLLSSVDTDRLTAFNELRSLATAAVCVGCPYGGKSKVAVERMLTAEAEAERARIDAETALAEAKRAHQKATTIGLTVLQGGLEQDDDNPPEAT